MHDPNFDQQVGCSFFCHTIPLLQRTTVLFACHSSIWTSTTGIPRFFPRTKQLSVHLLVGDNSENRPTNDRPTGDLPSFSKLICPWWPWSLSADIDAKTETVFWEEGSKKICSNTFALVQIWWYNNARALGTLQKFGHFVLNFDKIQGFSEIGRIISNLL